MIHFDIDSRYQDELVVGSAISRREGVIYSVVTHIVLILAIVLAPKLPIFQVSPEELERRRAELERQLRDQQDQRFVFVQPRIDMRAIQPPERAPLSDADRQAQTRETPPTPTNPLPFARGNSSDRVEAPNNDRPADDPTQQPATLQPQPDSQQARAEAPADRGFIRPEQPQPKTDLLGSAKRFAEQMARNQTFDNPQGGLNKPGAAIQFDTKGIEFGPWLRRFVAKVRSNWFIPEAAMIFKDHCVLTFNIYKDGHITDVTVIQPSRIEAFNHSAVGAIMASSPVPLPPDYPTEPAFFTVTFYYNEDPDR